MKDNRIFSIDINNDGYNLILSGGDQFWAGLDGKYIVTDVIQFYTQTGLLLRYKTYQIIDKCPVRGLLFKLLPETDLDSSANVSPFCRSLNKLGIKVL